MPLPFFVPSSPLFHFSPDSVLRLFTASRPGCALKVSPAALLRSRRYEWGKKKKKKALSGCGSCQRMKGTLLPGNLSEFIFAPSVHELEMIEHIKSDVKPRSTHWVEENVIKTV